MKVWRFVALGCVVALIGLLVMPVVVADARPYDSEVLGVLGDEAHWYWDIRYVPGEYGVTLRLQMDNMGGRGQSEYRIQSSEGSVPSSV